MTLACSGFTFGTASLPEYDGTSFAKNQDVILVSFNYRMNVFGFPTAPDLPSSGNNLGLLDQELALAWVQDNIAQFGGDKSKVTIMVSATSLDTLQRINVTFALAGPVSRVQICLVCYHPPGFVRVRTIPCRHHALVCAAFHPPRAQLSEIQRVRDCSRMYPGSRPIAATMPA